MSRLIEILEIYNEIESTFECIRLCETTMNDATRALKKDEDSTELKNIYESAKSDKAKFEKKLESLKVVFDKLLIQAKADPEFLQEIEKTTIVPEGLKHAFIAVKSELSPSKEIEKTEE